eukprot:3871306-Rhodomonas_salina.2
MVAIPTLLWRITATYGGNAHVYGPQHPKMVTSLPVLAHRSHVWVMYLGVSVIVCLGSAAIHGGSVDSDMLRCSEIGGSVLYNGAPPCAGSGRRCQILDTRYQMAHTAHHIPHTTYYVLQTTTNRILYAVYRIPHTANCRPQTAYTVPHTAYCIPHTTYRIPRTTYRIPHAILRYAASGTAIGAGPIHCPVLTWAMLLRVCYATSSTAIRSAAGLGYLLGDVRY